MERGVRGGLLCVLALGYSLVSPGHAIARPENGGWDFAVTPYLWAAGLSGDIALVDGETVHIDKSFADLLGALKFVAMAGAEARRDRFVILGDLFYLNLGTDGQGPLGFVDAAVDAEVFIPTLYAGYRILDEGPLFVDLLGGGRFTSLDVGVELNRPLQSVQRNRSGSSLAPVLGARMRAPLGGNWGVATHGDLAGLGMTDNVTWQVLATVHYVSDRWRLAAGYRHASVDFEKDELHANLAVSGPIFGLTYRF
jgi:hypothetical protein